MTCYFSNKSVAVGYTPSKRKQTADGYVLCCQGNDFDALDLICQKSLSDGSFFNYKGGCTDPTFTSSSCPQYCPGDNGFLKLRMCPVEDGQHACCDYGNNQNCSCEPGAEGALDVQADTVIALAATVGGGSTTTSPRFSIPTVDVTFRAPGASVSSQSSRASNQGSSLSSEISAPTDSTQTTTGTRGGSTSSITPSPTPAPDTDNLGIKVGVPVGVVGAIAILAVLVLLWRRRKTRSKDNPVSYSEKPAEGSTEPGVAVDHETGVVLDKEGTLVSNSAVLSEESRSYVHQKKRLALRSPFHVVDSDNGKV